MPHASTSMQMVVVVNEKKRLVKDMAGKFEIKKSSDNQFYFNLKAGNGEIILNRAC
jgi:Domain of unknown function (DUF1508)